MTKKERKEYDKQYYLKNKKRIQEMMRAVSKKRYEKIKAEKEFNNDPEGNLKNYLNVCSENWI